MNHSPIELREYLTQDGRNPFHEWLTNLKDRQARAKIRIRLNRIRLGNFGDCKAVGQGVFELRLTHGPGYRVYLGRKGQTVVILLYGGHKKNQSKDIKLAQKYWADYLEKQDE